MTQQEPTLTLSQAAEEIGVPATTLRRWTNRGQIPFLLTLGGQRRFTREQLRQITKQVLTNTDAAAELGVSASTLRRWASRGLVPFTKDIKGRRQFTWEHVQEIKARMLHRPTNHIDRQAA